MIIDRLYFWQVKSFEDNLSSPQVSLKLLYAPRYVKRYFSLEH
jgi:hypothetical protein